MSQFILTPQHLINGFHCLTEPVARLLKPEKMSPVSEEQVFHRQKTEDIKTLFRKLYPRGTDLSQGGTITGEELSHVTKLALQTDPEKEFVFFNAGFKNLDGSKICMMDMVINRTKSIDIYLLKTALLIKEPDYIMEAGYKYSVIKESGLKKPIKVHIAFLNEEYVYEGTYDYESLFKIVEITPKARRNLVLIDRYSARIKRYHEKNEIPEKGKRIKFCTNPFPCQFHSFCWGTSPKKGIKENEPFIKQGKIRDFITKIDFDRLHYFLEVECFRPAIPIYKNTKPYQNIYFQYCILSRKTGTAEYVRSDFFGDPSQDTRQYFIKKLLFDTRLPGNIIVYRKSKIIECLAEISQSFEEYTEEINKLISRLIYLEEPFEIPSKKRRRKKKHYTLTAILSSLDKTPKSKRSNNNLLIRKYENYNQQPIVDRINMKRALQESLYINVLDMTKIVSICRERF